MDKKSIIHVPHQFRGSFARPISFVEIDEKYISFILMGDYNVEISVFQETEMLAGSLQCNHCLDDFEGGEIIQDIAIGNCNTVLTVTTNKRELVFNHPQFLTLDYTVVIQREGKKKRYDNGYRINCTRYPKNSTYANQ